MKSKLGRKPIPEATAIACSGGVSQAGPVRFGEQKLPAAPITQSGQQELLTHPEAATYLRLSPLTLATWASNRRVEIPFAKIGRRVMYRRADLDGFIAANTKGANATQEGL